LLHVGVCRKSLSIQMLRIESKEMAITVNDIGTERRYLNFLQVYIRCVYKLCVCVVRSTFEVVKQFTTLGNAIMPKVIPIM
jgi:hypothetical protein